MRSDCRESIHIVLDLEFRFRDPEATTIQRFASFCFSNGCRSHDTFAVIVSWHLIRPTSTKEKKMSRYMCYFVTCGAVQCLKPYKVNDIIISLATVLVCCVAWAQCPASTKVPQPDYRHSTQSPLHRKPKWNFSHRTTTATTISLKCAVSAANWPITLTLSPSLYCCLPFTSFPLNRQLNNSSGVKHIGGIKNGNKNRIEWDAAVLTKCLAKHVQLIK